MLTVSHGLSRFGQQNRCAIQPLNVDWSKMFYCVINSWLFFIVVLHNVTDRLELLIWMLVDMVMSGCGVADVDTAAAVAVWLAV